MDIIFQCFRDSENRPAIPAATRSGVQRCDLNVSQSLITTIKSNKLKTLSLLNNSNLTHLGCYENNLTSIDLSKCPTLKSVRFECNPLKIINFGDITTPFHISHWSSSDFGTDIRGITSTNFKIISSKLKCISISKEITCENQFLSLDISQCSALKKLDSDHKLETLILNDTLTNFECDFSSCKSLNISGSALRSLLIKGDGGGYPSTLNLSVCLMLQKLDCQMDNL